MKALQIKTIIQALPVITILVIAIGNVALVFRYDLSPWHGGGFGMFSSHEHHTSRYIQVMVRTPQGFKLLNLEAYTDELKRLKNLPTPARLSAFLNKTACTAQLPAQTSMITLSYYKLNFDREPLKAEKKWEGRTNGCE